MTELSEQRSRTMRAVRSRDTGPELAVRHVLRNLGYRGYRIHRRELPGNPDIAFLGRKKAIFVNGCFWHGHECLRGARTPTSNQSYWIHKIESNKRRDEANIARLRKLGWSVLNVWECELQRMELMADKLIAFISADGSS